MAARKTGSYLERQAPFPYKQTPFPYKQAPFPYKQAPIPFNERDRGCPRGQGRKVEDRAVPLPALGIKLHHRILKRQEAALQVVAPRGELGALDRVFR